MFDFIFAKWKTDFTDFQRLRWNCLTQGEDGFEWQCLKCFEYLSGIFHDFPSWTILFYNILSKNNKKQPNHTFSKCLRPKVVSLAKKPWRNFTISQTSLLFEQDSDSRNSNHNLDHMNSQNCNWLCLNEAHCLAQSWWFINVYQISITK